MEGRTQAARPATASCGRCGTPRARAWSRSTPGASFGRPTRRPRRCWVRVKARAWWDRGSMRLFRTSGPTPRVGRVSARVEGTLKSGAPATLDVRLERTVSDGAPLWIGTVRPVEDTGTSDDAPAHADDEMAQTERLIGLGRWVWNLESGVAEISEGLADIFGVQPGRSRPTSIRSLNGFTPMIVRRSLRVAATHLRDTRSPQCECGSSARTVRYGMSSPPVR